MQLNPFQLEPESHETQETPLQFNPLGHVQLLRALFQVLPEEQVTQENPFQFEP